MSGISENNSEDNKSSRDTEYHSESGTELETGDYTLSNPEQKDTIWNVQFPMPYTFPKLYLTLQEVIDNTSDQKWNLNMEEDPDEALHYIINHFHINEVAESIPLFPYTTLFRSPYMIWSVINHFS